MAGHGEAQDRLQELAIAALLRTRTIRRAAAAIDVDERTLRRWLQDPSFVKAYRAARAAVVENALADLQRTARKAVACLRRNLTCGRASDEIRAALGVLGHAVKGVELIDLQERVEALEAKAKRRETK
jgi:hypothetical protein